MGQTTNGPGRGLGSPETRIVIEQIRHERLRQISKKGWDLERDDELPSGELAQAAACYAAGETIYGMKMRAGGRSYEVQPFFKDFWPWEDRWWKPKKRRHDLIRAAALIVAEIERLDRQKVEDEDGNDG